AAVYRLARGANAALALINLMHEAFTVFHADDHVVPESQQRGLESCGVQRGAQTLNLRGFTGTIHAGERDEQGGVGNAMTHWIRPVHIRCAALVPIVTTLVIKNDRRKYSIVNTIGKIKARCNKSPLQIFACKMSITNFALQ